MGVSENKGTPKSSMLIRFSIVNHPFWGTPIFENIQLDHHKGTVTSIITTWGSHSWGSKLQAGVLMVWSMVHEPNFDMNIIGPNTWSKRWHFKHLLNIFLVTYWANDSDWLKQIAISWSVPLSEMLLRKISQGCCYGTTICSQHQRSHDTYKCSL